MLGRGRLSLAGRATDTVKDLFLILVAAVIPLFFVLIYVLSEYNKLAALRRRCQSAASRVGMTAGNPSYEDAVVQYDKARSRFPGRWIALAFGFGPVDKSRGDTDVGP
jgi:hypothetical protein